jgi:uncharacterized protein YndB with AHSA1/START domain
MTTKTETTEFTITRTFDAPRQLVWDAWTDPDQISKWFGPKGLHTPRDTVEVDLRPGGAWRATMVHDETAERYDATFEYREIDEPNKLVLQAARPDNPDTRKKADGSFITVTFEETDGKTLMTFFAEGVTQTELDMGVVGGWTTSFEKIDAVVAA